MLTCHGLQGELEHKRVKRFYSRTNKNAHFTAQITRLQQRQAHFETKRREREGTIGKRRPARKQHSPKTRHPLRRALATLEPRVSADPDAHHHISTDTRDAVNIIRFLREHPEDAACKVRTHSCVFCDLSD